MGDIADAPSKMLRLDSVLWTQVAAAAERTGRTVRQEAEARLRDSLDRGAWATVEPELAPRPRALGRLLGILANELVAYAPQGKENEYLQHGLARMLARLSGKTLPGPEHDAATMADYWQLRLFNAKERTYENGTPVPMTAEQRALAEIQFDLATGQAAPVQRPEEATTGGRAVKEEARARPRKKRAAA